MSQARRLCQVRLPGPAASRTASPERDQARRIGWSAAVGRNRYGVIAGSIWNRSQSRRKDRMKLFRLIAVPWTW